MNGTTNQEIQPPNKKLKSLLVLVAVAVLALLVSGSIYFFNQRSEREISDETIKEVQTQPDEILQALEQQSESDQIIDIESDLELTELDDLDAELKGIENLLNF